MVRLTRLMPIWLIAHLIIGAPGCHEPTPKMQSAGDVRDGVFIHINHGEDDPHACTMALKMASLMSADKDVLVYFDVKGVGVVLKDAKDLQRAPFESSKQQLEALMAKGVPIYVCPGCLKAANKTPEDLMPGVKIADKDAFFNFTKGRILTLDY